MSLRKIKSASTLGGLASALSEAARTLPTDLNKITQDVAKYATQRLIYETPVDTSQALSNWQVGLSVGSTLQLPAYFIGDSGSTQNMLRLILFVRARTQATCWIFLR